MPDEAVGALVEHFMSGAEGEFVWIDSDGSRQDLRLTFTSEDLTELEEAIRPILDAMPQAISDSVETAAKTFLKELWKNWPTARNDELNAFRQRLEERWGGGLNYLRMLLVCSREMGHDAYKRQCRSKSKRHRFRRWVLVRLHCRACQIADEIICLMENGFADGAMARWRTLHELSVVAVLIAGGDEDLAERYILHDAVEVKRQADDYESSQVPLGYAPLGSLERAIIDERFNAVIGRFGPEFGHPQGWASKHLNMKKPTFKHLQEAADRAGLSSTYKLASFGVHASARSLFFNLASIGDEVLLAGRSNAGLTKPGQRTAHSLFLITSLSVGGIGTNLDRVAQLKSLMLASEKVGMALARAERRLKRDEIAYQKQMAGLRKAGAKAIKRRHPRQA